MIASINISNIFASNKFNLQKPAKKIEIGNSLSIKKIEENKENKISIVSFEFKITYKIEKEVFGNVDFTGALLWKEKNDDGEIKKKWEKDKKLPEKYSFIIMNSILRKCIISAIDITQQVNLPPPINIPIIQEKKVQNIEYIG